MCQRLWQVLLETLPSNDFYFGSKECRASLQKLLSYERRQGNGNQALQLLQTSKSAGSSLGSRSNNSYIRVHSQERDRRQPNPTLHVLRILHFLSTNSNHSRRSLLEHNWTRHFTVRDQSHQSSSYRCP